MIAALPYGKDEIQVELPGHVDLYSTTYPVPVQDASTLVLSAVREPIQSPALLQKLQASDARSVVIVVSDITRPIPYSEFLPDLISEIETAGIESDAITILIATGMHRPSTPDEHNHMFGPELCANYRIIDHRAEEPSEIKRIDGISYGGRKIELNRHFLDADFRISTGLVEPHFMAGFSGGRKAICPGLCSLESIKAFHSYAFLSDPLASNGQLEGNPLHSEALSIALQARVDFALNVVINRDHKLIAATAGDLEASHIAACDFVRENACPKVRELVDVVLTSSGGYPLDATFYQCVKGMNACLSAVKPGGSIIALGGCAEGIGGPEFTALLAEYSGRWKDFLNDAAANPDTPKDQWQFQMQAKVLAHVGQNNLQFITEELDVAQLSQISVNAVHTKRGQTATVLQQLVDQVLKEGKSLAVIPEGPYCVPQS